MFLTFGRDYKPEIDFIPDKGFASSAVVLFLGYMKLPTSPKPGRAICRVEDLMAHSRRYDFSGRSRLASEAGISSSTLWRMIHGVSECRFEVITKVASALERQLGRTIDPRDIVAPNGEFLTKFACAVVGCEGCLPPSSRDEHGYLKEIYKSIKPGEWVCSRYPKGFNNQGGVNA